MTRDRTRDADGTGSAGAWLRARRALAPFLWLGVAMLLAGVLAGLAQLVLPGLPSAGAWNPTWSFAEVWLEGQEEEAARRLVEEEQGALPEGQLAWRAGEGGTWLVLSGPADRQELLETLRRVAGAHGFAPTQIGFGSNLLRLTRTLADDPTRVTEAVEALLPAMLLSGGLALLLVGEPLRRRLRRERSSPVGPRASPARRAVAGLGLGILLALLVQGVGWLMAALGRPIVEQDWLLESFERGGAELVAIVLFVVLVAPLAEEVFFRGYLLEALAPTWGRGGSVLLSSAAFAVVHGHAPALPAYFLYGVGLALAARRSGSLLVPVVAHVTVNALSVASLAL